MEVSVVMTTFHGEAHLPAQLDSLRNQTYVPNEVLIFDDQSEDDTIHLVQEYIQRYGLSHWILEVNPERYGWKRNFIQALQKAQGDYIFLCDQDDIWYPDKIERMLAAAKQHPEILLLACDYHVVYEEGAIKAKVYRKTKEERAGLVSQYRFKKSFFMNPNPGCSYLLRRDFVREVLPWWFSDAPHDEFLWLMATMRDGAYFINQPFMDYLRYANNASGVRYKDLEGQQKNLEYIGEMLNRMSDYAGQHPGQVRKEYRQEIEKAKVWCEKRKRLIATRNPLRWILLMPWWGYYNSTMNCLSDLYLTIFGHFRRNR